MSWCSKKQHALAALAATWYTKEVAYHFLGRSSQSVPSGLR
jgi:hypothetical protein